MKEAVLIFFNGVVGVFAVMFVLYGALKLAEIIFRLILRGADNNGE